MEIMHYFRPEWTCGRYHEEREVAIMYNLIAGYSYFFEGYSANVIGEILKVGRNEDINVVSIASVTGISMDSLSKFFILLANNGLLTETLPTEESIRKYREALFKKRREEKSNPGLKSQLTRNCHWMSLMPNKNTLQPLTMVRLSAHVCLN